MTNIDIRPATQELLERYYGKVPLRTMKALVAVKDGAPVAVSGIFLDKEGARYVLFSEMKPEVANDRRLMVRAIKEMKKLLETVRIPVHACADKNISNDGVILRHLGCVEIAEGIYEWRS